MTLLCSSITRQAKFPFILGHWLSISQLIDPREESIFISNNFHAHEHEAVHLCPLSLVTFIY